MSEELERGPDGSPPGHIEKMLNRGAEAPEETASGEAEVIGSRPENIPEKFWDAEKGEVNVDALLKSQQDAEKALRARETGVTDENEGNETPNEGTETPEDTPTQTNVIASADAEWQEKGELSEDTFKSLESVGITREMVATYIDGQQAVVNQLQSAAYEPFQGKDGYEAAANWAAENLDESEIQAIDLQLTSSNPAIVAQGAKALLSRFKQDGNYEPPVIRGSGNSMQSGATYRSRAEMVKDMNSPRYRTDSGFRKEVEEKLRRSNLARA